MADWRNEKVPDEDKTSKRPSLRAETLNGAEAVVVTVKDVDRIDVDDADSEGGKRRAYVLGTEEYQDPPLGFWLNRSGLKTLSEKLGERPTEWLGMQVPLVVVRVTNPRSGNAMKSLQVAAPDEWEDMLAQFGNRNRRSATRTVVPPSRKSVAAKKQVARKRRSATRTVVPPSRKSVAAKKQVARKRR